MSNTACTAFLDQGNFAPTIAQAMPSRIRYLTFVWISDGISESWTESTQLQTCPVIPSGALHGAREDENLILCKDTGASLAILATDRIRDMVEGKGLC